MNDQPKDNSPNLKLKHFYGNARTNFIRKHGNLKFTPDHMNDILVENWEYFKLPSAIITQEAFKKTHLLPLYPPDKGTKHQACLAATQTPNGKKADDVEPIAKYRIAPTDTE